MDFNLGSSFTLALPIQLSQIPAAKTSCGWDTLARLVPVTTLTPGAAGVAQEDHESFPEEEFY